MPAARPGVTGLLVLLLLTGALLPTGVIVVMLVVTPALLLLPLLLQAVGVVGQLLVIPLLLLPPLPSTALLLLLLPGVTERLVLTFALSGLLLLPLPPKSIRSVMWLLPLLALLRLRGVVGAAPPPLLLPLPLRTNAVVYTVG